MKRVLIVAVCGVLWAQGSPDEAFIGARGRYWAFQKVTRPAVPDIQVSNSIDAFILQGLQQKQIEPAKPLNRTQLIRRVTYDLTGLPPTPAEVEAFVKDR